MNTRTLKTWVSVVLCGSMLAGCASLEERLASNDPETKKSAERQLLYQQNYEFDPAKRMAAVKRVSNEEVLAAFAGSSCMTVGVRSLHNLI